MENDRKPSDSFRKSPRQKRSKLLVDSILEATTRVLESIGFVSVTTNKVAEKAGVSIGSLYQYFPNKDSIFASLVDRQMEDRTERIQKLLRSTSNESLEKIIELTIGDLVDVLYLKRKVVLALFLQVPKLKKTQEVLYRRNKITLMLVEFLETKKVDLRSANLINEQMSVLTNAVLGAIQTAILEDFKTLTPKMLKLQLTDLACRYLLKPQLG